MRNRCVFENFKPDIRASIQMAIHIYNDHSPSSDLSHVEAPDITDHNVPLTQRWNPPDATTVKINVDGATATRTIAAGIIARNHLGDVMNCRTYFDNTWIGVDAAIEAEARGFLKGLELAREMHAQQPNTRFVIEGDSKKVVSYINDDRLIYPWRIRKNIDSSSSKFNPIVNAVFNFAKSLLPSRLVAAIQGLGQLFVSPRGSSSSTSSSSSSSSSSPRPNLVHLVWDVEAGGFVAEEIIQNSKPEVSTLHEYDLGKTILGVVAPVTSGLLALYNSKSSSPSLVRLVVFSLSFGFAFIWNGILLRRAFPKFASVIEEIGVALVFLAFFGLVGNVLPEELVWAPWLCCLLTITPFLLLRCMPLMDEHEQDGVI
ncbi:hypothetical protein BVC80_9011g59 [Macleaya cordata]|uniref:RNase H type-1 domain-containing protein n=1 Tax=Macleaya cordata TaxID=56857 RepID=A0A200QQ06_MACCD|nr:hypothetical protein BVC80_9011g59 [Macleaya cordata]